MDLGKEAFIWNSSAHSKFSGSGEINREPSTRKVGCHGEVQSTAPFYEKVDGEQNGDHDIILSAARLTRQCSQLHCNAPCTDYSDSRIFVNFHSHRSLHDSRSSQCGAITIHDSFKTGWRKQLLQN